MQLFWRTLFVITPRQPLLKMSANTAAICTNCTAVALTDLPAGFVSVQRSAPSHPPTKDVNSAAYSFNPAGHFSGNHAIYATNVTTTATFVSYF
jgi:hypothetical protein